MRIRQVGKICLKSLSPEKVVVLLFNRLFPLHLLQPTLSSCTYTYVLMQTSGAKITVLNLLPEVLIESQNSDDVWRTTFLLKIFPAIF